MEGIDWIKLQEEEFGQGLMMSVSNVDILGGHVRPSGNGFSPVFLPWGEPGIANSGNGLILDPGMTSGGATGLDSLDCLLSASNSQTDAASLEDDGISMIFSDCKSLWNFNPVPPLSGPGMELSPPDKDQDPDNNQTKRKRSGSHQGFINCESNDSDAVGFHLTSENQARLKKPKSDRHPVSSSNISFQQASSSASSGDEPDAEAIVQMKEMIYRAAAFRPVHFGAETVDKPKRKNVRISSDPQTVAARQRRERISERIRVLQKLVPGGSKMDTASMLDEAANYLKFLRSQVKALEAISPKIDAFPANTSLPFSPFVNYTFAPQFSIQNQNPVNKSLS